MTQFYKYRLNMQQENSRKEEKRRKPTVDLHIIKSAERIRASTHRTKIVPVATSSMRSGDIITDPIQLPRRILLLVLQCRLAGGLTSEATGRARARA
jgi:hypothetical protein